MMTKTIRDKYLLDPYNHNRGIELFCSEASMAAVLKPNRYSVKPAVGGISQKMMKYVFYTVEEVEEANDWRELLKDNRSPGKIMSGRAYLVLVGTMLEAGRRQDIEAFETLLIQQITSNILILPSLERGRESPLTFQKPHQHTGHGPADMLVPSKGLWHSFWWKPEGSLSWWFSPDMTNGGKLIFIGIPFDISKTPPAHRPRPCSHVGTFKSPDMTKGDVLKY
ncbi:hypothetical protein [Absidia glauca]|uniref:Uncharacterized protein n=1 Tax=Absidia glauca TaxID=4829 RepID=A0A163TDE8_ABSGL|nr:hypothetical protein [Absidia glauca]